MAKRDRLHGQRERCGSAESDVKGNTSQALTRHEIERVAVNSVKGS
jgi:hypothetical protein